MNIEITGSYPIILDGETAGELTVVREGLFWNFDAKCEKREEIVRLSVYGEGIEGYLGIMEPMGDMLSLNRKFSRAALRDFPTKINHAGQKGEQEFIEPEIDEVPAAPEEPPQAVVSSPPDAYSDRIIEVPAPPEDDKPPPDAPRPPPSGGEELCWHPCAVPCSLFLGIREKKACSAISGAFVAQKTGWLLLAVPEEIAVSLPDADAIVFSDEINLAGNNYLICKIKRSGSISEF